MFFEGSEKKFELGIAAQRPNLRRRLDWHHVVGACGAQVLSSISNDTCDAYLLSESSLFVYDARVIMLTCGQTELISAVEAVFEQVLLAEVEYFIYERKNEQVPEHQSTDFEDDARRLSAIMPGTTYCFGDQDGNHIRLFHLLKDYLPAGNDTTLEILMHDLDPAASAPFFSRPGVNAVDVGLQTGLATLFQGFSCDGHVFDPMGYSLNAISGREYYTLHVTPQPSCSYASFETNRTLNGDVTPLVERVLNVFRPKHCLLMLFEREDGSCLVRDNYHIEHRVSHALECGYRVQFASYRVQVASSQRVTP